jgi:N utilization substance protein B
VGKVEWAIMLVAAFEMRYAEDVPPKVAIDEAIELAKRYGSDEAPTFVNGVLDRVMHSAESAKTARA